MLKIKKIILTLLLVLCLTAGAFATTIDMGTEAIDDVTNLMYNYTYINADNPANASGVITSVEIYCGVSGADDVEVATFYSTGTNEFSTRDSEALGDIGSGYSEHSITLDVESGDYIGVYYSSGAIKGKVTGGGNGYWSDSGDEIPCTEKSFNLSDNRRIRIYATGITPPSAPTNVSATDGTYTDKVRITWTKSDGATGYQVYRDTIGLGWLGDVSVKDDTGAGAPSITTGTANASDGTSTDYVTLSITGESVSNGTTHTYKVKARNDAGESGDSSTNNGYRGHGSLNYQWYRSAADSDANYSSISGATTDPYNDTAAPEDGSGRYYKCYLTATGATPQYTNADRGYRLVEEAGLNVLFLFTDF